MYSINGYGDMIADSVRMEAYVCALRAAVKPGAVVVDIGTGTGIFALIACQLGARRVYAIEPGDAIAVGREIARANGYAETIEFIQGLSTRITLPERADVIVSDLRGVLPLCTGHLPAIADARARFLAPAGALIPRRDTLWLACVEAPEAYAHIAGPWFDGAYGLNLRAAFDMVTNTWERASVRPEQLVSAPQLLGVIDYTTVASPDFAATVRLAVTRAATTHGLCAWFDATLAEGIEFSNAPGQPEAIYGKAFFPWSEPVALQPGDEVIVTLKADLVGEDYLWSWATRIADAAGRARAEFHQSSFFGEPLAPAQLRKQSAAHVATLNDDGLIAQESLRMMQEGAALGDIARHLAQRFPGRFATWQNALSHVGELSARYSR
jgi:protein arginine N-methyltransferase 1